MARLDTHNGSDLFLKVLFLVWGCHKREGRGKSQKSCNVRKAPDQKIEGFRVL